MQVFRSTAIFAPVPRQPVSAKTLRMWCAPEVILGITNLTDELILLPHIIDQARHSGAKIILAHAQNAQSARKTRASSASLVSSIGTARETLDRMARQLRWLGFTCEPLLLSGQPESEIPLLVRSCGADRVLFGFEEDPDLTKTHIIPLYEQLLRRIHVPVCALGTGAIHSNRKMIRNVTLAISSESSCEVPLSFASRLAQEFRARLTVLHVFERKPGDRGQSAAQDVLAMLPFTAWREAELFCPTKISLREGNPADEILNYCTATEQDLVILCSPGNTRSRESWRDGVCHRTIAGARCPVFIAGSDSDATISVAVPVVSASDKFPPRGQEVIEKKERKEVKT